MSNINAQNLIDGYCQTFVSILLKCKQGALNNYIGTRERVLLLHQHFTSLPHPFNPKEEIET
jgi:hypothetical protein